MSVILDAFVRAQTAYRTLHALPNDATDVECEPFHRIIDEAREVMSATVATRNAEHAAKLRIGMAGIDQSAEGNLLFYGLVDLVDDASAYSGDFFETLVWDTIRDLDSQAEVEAEREPRWEDALETFRRTRAIWNVHAKIHAAAEEQFFAGRTPETEKAEAAADAISTLWCGRDSDALRALLAIPAATYKIALEKLYLATAEGEPVEAHVAEIRAFGPDAAGPSV